MSTLSCESIDGVGAQKRLGHLREHCLTVGYRGEVNVVLTLDMDAPPTKEGYEVKGYRINEGDKIAQLVPVKPLTMFEVEESEVLTETKRGEGGFGSTGK